MATPINITPTLQNKSSERFNELLKKQEQVKVSAPERERITSLVNTVLSKSKIK